LFFGVLLPDSTFGFDDNYLATRLALVDIPNHKQDAPFNIKLYCPKVIEGIDKICDWVSNLHNS